MINVKIKDSTHISLARKFPGQGVQVEIRDLNDKQKCTHSIPKPLTTLEWSPNSKYFAVAVTSPQERSDNGISIFDISGKGLFASKCQSLTQIHWKPKPKQQQQNKTEGNIINQFY